MMKNYLRKKLLEAVGWLILLTVLTAVPAFAETTMSKTSATIVVGESVTLQCKENGKAVSNAVWNSSNRSVATVSKGKVIGKTKGSTVISATVNGKSAECVVSVVRPLQSGDVRYNVLVLDCSGSMKGTPLSRAKTAAKRFAKAVLSAEGTNYMAVVSLNSDSKICIGFSDSLTSVSKAIDALKANGSTNMYAAFSNADSLLRGAPSGKNIVKNVILCSDGLPEKGTKQITGRYVSADHKYYAFANAVYKTDTAMKNAGDFVYALGFFHNSVGNDLTFGKRLMKDLASKDKYYVIKAPEDISEVFDDIAEKVTSVSISQKSLSMYVGDSAVLTTYVNGTAKSAAWTSSDTAVATVSASGKVTGKKPGTSTVNAKAEGKKVSCKVTVKEKPSVQLNKKSLSLVKGKAQTLKAAVSGTSASVQWKSSDTNVAVVSASGKVTAKKAGSCTITASAGKASDKCTVTVTNPPYPESAKGFSKHHYKRYDKPMTWKKARAYCKKLGGHLLTITSAEEQTFVEQYILPGKKNFYWLGCIRDKDYKFSQWITGEPLNYTHYDTQNREPNNYKGNENVLVIYRIPNPLGGSSGALKWNDLNETGYCNGEKFFGEENSGFICEWDS